jgi:methanol metabolism-related c-type cytochrome
MTVRRWAGCVAGASLAVLLATSIPASAQDSNANAPKAGGDEEKPYQVEDGKVDPGTYNGYRRYTESCLRCHGPDGLGSSYAPNLTDSLKTLSQEQFNETVINGRKNLAAGQEKVMPAFGEVEDVAQYIQDIYAYLKARSDGALGRGRPQRIQSANSG